MLFLMIQLLISLLIFCASLFITHDLASARYLADRIIVLKNGKIIEENNSEKLIQNPREDYTKQLVNAASPGWLNQITK